MANENRRRVLIDTHVLIWSVYERGLLSRKARAVVESFSTEVFVSAASAWEISTKFRLGKLTGADRLALDVGGALGELGFAELPILMPEAQRAGLLAGHHRDPFDRMLIAQALTANLPIVSADVIFDSYGVTRIW